MMLSIITTNCDYTRSDRKILTDSDRSVNTYFWWFLLHWLSHDNNSVLEFNSFHFHLVFPRLKYSYDKYATLSYQHFMQYLTSSMNINVNKKTIINTRTHTRNIQNYRLTKCYQRCTWTERISFKWMDTLCETLFKMWYL